MNTTFHPYLSKKDLEHCFKDNIHPHILRKMTKEELTMIWNYAFSIEIES